MMEVRIKTRFTCPQCGAVHEVDQGLLSVHYPNKCECGNTETWNFTGFSTDPVPFREPRRFEERSPVKPRAISEKPKEEVKD